MENFVDGSGHAGIVQPLLISITPSQALGEKSSSQPAPFNGKGSRVKG